MNGIQKTLSKLFEKYTYLPLTKENFRVAANITLHRRLIALSSDSHPSSAPYLSGDTFVHMANHVLNDKKLLIEPKKVKKGEVIFVNAQMLHYFFRTIHPLIHFPYILITHNGDTHIDVPFTSYIDKKIIRWYAQNVVTTHSKITPIPIGLENLFYYNHGDTNIFRVLQAVKREKMARILMEFSISTNSSVRKPIFNLFRDHPLVYPLSERLSAPTYLKLLASHKFVLSPPGNGLDCHRTWEAMYLGTIPIVERSVTTEYFESLGLPMLLVSDWNSVTSFTEDSLDRLYNKIQKSSDRSALFYEYWEKKITKDKGEKLR